MESNVKKTTKWIQFAVLGVLALAAVVAVVVKLETNSPAFAYNGQVTFPSPADAGVALVKAAKNDDENALAGILGLNTKTLLSTGDKLGDKAALDSFASKYDKMNRWVDMSDGSRVLYIGADNFAFPVPLAKNPSGRWYFDGVAGAEEVRAREIGRDELLAVDACAAIASAQDVYFARSGSREYAQRIISTPGKQDGLYWPASGRNEPSPLGVLNELPKASLAQLPGEKPLVIDGYNIRILTAQGDDVSGGAMNYIAADGKMTGGFAILAAPVKYAETGVMTFMTGSDGIVYERDFGPDTVKIASSIQDFNPTEDWSPVAD